MGRVGVELGQDIREVIDGEAHGFSISQTAFGHVRTMHAAKTPIPPNRAMAAMRTFFIPTSYHRQYTREHGKDIPSLSRL
jgi:hypothetical protein